MKVDKQDIEAETWFFREQIIKMCKIKEMNNYFYEKFNKKFLKYWLNRIL